MDTETIVAIVTACATFLCGMVAKKIPNFNNQLIPVQNILIGVLVAVIEYFITNDFSTAIAVSGLVAGGSYDIFHNLNKLLNNEEEE